MRTNYEVIVGNIGTVYSGSDESTARAQFEYYENDSRTGYGRAGGEDVTLLAGGEIIREHFGRLADCG